MANGTLGFIGLGNMGAPMAANLADAGFAVIAYDVIEGRAPEGVAAAGTVAAVAGAAETVCLSLPDGDASLAVARAIAGAPGRASRRVVDFSTVGVVAAEAIAAELAGAGLDYVDAPVSGGRAGAVAGTLTVMWAGPAGLADDLRRAFDAVAANVFRVGDRAGQGQAMKLLNNFLSGTALAATAEAVAYGVARGLAPATVIDVLNASTGRNSATDDKFPNRILTGGYDSGFQTSLMAKDLALYLESACAENAVVDVGEPVADAWRRTDAALPGSDCTRIYELVKGRSG